MGARHHTGGSPLRRFVRTYGWRAYALPVLTVITIIALVRTPAHHHPTRAAAADASGRPAANKHTSAHKQTSARKHIGARQHVEGLSPGSSSWQPGSTPAAQDIRLRTDDLSSCAQNTYRQLILVSISRQHLWVCEAHRQVNETPVTTGSTVNGDQTPVGSWRLQAEQRDRYLVGPGYRDYVKYWMPYNGDFGLHDASWQTIPFGSQQYHVDGSHGCVHVPTRTMAWLYHWATVGQTVVTIES